MSMSGKKESCYSHHIANCDDHLSICSTNGRDFYGGSRIPIHRRQLRRPICLAHNRA